MLLTHGYDIEVEAARRQKEKDGGVEELLLPRGSVVKESAPGEEPEEDARGRPEMDDQERTSDPEAALRGKQPKPSSPDGSMDNVE